MSEEKALTVGQLKPKPEVYELDPSKPYIIVIPDRVTNNEAISLVESLGNQGIRATIICSDKVRVFESMPILPILAPMIPQGVPQAPALEAPAKKTRKKATAAKAAGPKRVRKPKE